VALKADGLSAVMLVTTAVVILAVGIYAQRDFRPPAGASETGGIAGVLDAPAGDLEWAEHGLSGTGPLHAVRRAGAPDLFRGSPGRLDGRAETLAAALRYLLFALLGSVLYLLGAVLLYGTYGTLDIPLLAHRIADLAEQLPPAVIGAGALMTVGLLAKTALFPLHLWLPPAHAGAPPAASAILSALVVKASFFLILRIWFDLMPGLLSLPGVQILGVMGAGPSCSATWSPCGRSGSSC
jgi:multicomponent Na+:H+ antiporter subunit D